MKDFFKKIPTIRTEHLTLRKMQLSDLSDVYSYSHDPEVTKYLLWSTHPNPDHTKRYLKAVEKYYAKGLYFDWAIVENESERMIGTCGFARLDPVNQSGEIGYVLNRDFWGKGYAHEAARAVMDIGFNTLCLKRIEARFMVENIHSSRVMEKLGMRYEGVKRAELYVKGSFRDIGYYSILKEEFKRPETTIMQKEQV